MKFFVPSLIKAKKLPVGTVHGNRKKVAEGKWKYVSKKTGKKPPLKSALIKYDKKFKDQKEWDKLAEKVNAVIAQKKLKDSYYPSAFDRSRRAGDKFYSPNKETAFALVLDMFGHKVLNDEDHGKYLVNDFAIAADILEKEFKLPLTTHNILMVKYGLPTISF
jgi:hypothetical protein